MGSALGREWEKGRVPRWRSGGEEREVAGEKARALEVDADEHLLLRFGLELGAAGNDERRKRANCGSGLDFYQLAL